MKKLQNLRNSLVYKYLRLLHANKSLKDQVFELSMENQQLILENQTLNHEVVNFMQQNDELATRLDNLRSKMYTKAEPEKLQRTCSNCKYVESVSSLPCCACYDHIMWSADEETRKIQ